MSFRRILLPIAVVCILASSRPVDAVPNRESDKDYLRKVKLPVEWSKTFIPFERRADSWETVLKWFEDETGTKIIRHYPTPTGTFTFINPRDSFGNPRMYSLVEVFDIINEILQGSTKHSLLRNGNSLTLIPADGSFQEWQFPRVAPADLPNFGRTEVVRMSIVVNDQDVDLVAGQVKKLLGEFGHVISVGDGRLMLRGTVQSLQLVVEVLKQ